MLHYANKLCLQSDIVMHTLKKNKMGNVVFLNECVDFACRKNSMPCGILHGSTTKMRKMEIAMRINMDKGR